MTNMLLITFYKLNIISFLEIHRCQFVKLKKLVLLTVPRYKMQMPSPYPNLHTFPVTIKGSYSDCPIPASFLYSLIQTQPFWERFMVWRCRHQSVNV